MSSKLSRLQVPVFALLALSLVASAGASQRLTSQDRSDLDAPRDCERTCRALSEEVFNRCIHDGGSREDCAAEARRALTECLDRCPARPTCADQCAIGAERVYDACIDHGGDPTDCRERAEHYLNDCTRRCRIAACHERCEHVFALAYRRCIENGGDPEDCRRLARRELGACVVNCRP